ncbi:MAG: hypothetical protein ABSB95_05140 [Dissulfurispiraceae bacterium]|jgi:Rod binding domain-containing protein
MSQNIDMAQPSVSGIKSQTIGQSDARTAGKQMETVFLNELLRIMMEQTSFGQDRTVSVFLPAITSEISTSLAERGIGLGDFFMKKASAAQNGASGVENAVSVQRSASGEKEVRTPDADPSTLFGVNILGNPPI